jgi:3-oxoacyl-[acyl-carrier protein] reductase
MINAIVTGAGQGIGRAIVKKLYSLGVTIYACDINPQALAELVTSFPGIKIFSFDISNEQSVKSFFDEIRDFDCSWLVNNAGRYYGKNIMNYKPADILEIFGVNCFGAIYCSAFFAQNLLDKQKKGAIVNMASVSAMEGSSDAPYSMTKAAIISLTKSTAMNFAPLIRVNAVAPGLVETKMLENITSDRLKEFRTRELIPEPITPDQIAESVYFLLSDNACHITGTTLDVNNGNYLR